MAKPHYVLAFEHFKENTDDPLIAYVAFGLYVDAEYTWASGKAAWPARAEYKQYYDCTLPHNGHTYTDNADQVLLGFSQSVVDAERDKFIKEATAGFRTAVKKARPFWKGVAEAVIGALIWSVILIVASIVAARNGIDILEAYHKAATSYQVAPSHPSKD